MTLLTANNAPPSVKSVSSISLRAVRPVTEIDAGDPEDD